MYVDGQAIAIKLSKQITKVTENMKRTITCHNVLPGVAALTFDDVKDPSSDLYSNFQTSTPSGHAVANATRRKVIELHCLKERCEEEISLIRVEMLRLLAFLEKQMEVTTMAANAKVADEPLELGLKSLLLLRRAEYTKKLQALKTLWVGLVDIPTNHNQVIDYHQFLDDNVVSSGDTPLADVEDSDDDSASDYDSDE